MTSDLLAATDIGRGDGDDFFDGGLAFHDFVPTIFAHWDVAIADGLGAQFGGLGAVCDEFLHGLSDEDHFVNRKAAGEAGVAAAIAAFG